MSLGSAQDSSVATETTERDQLLRQPRPERDDPALSGTSPPLGFIGIGMMGLPMVQALVRAGHAVLACDSDAARLSMLVDACGSGAVHTTPVAAEVGERCEVVLLMLPTSEHVAGVLLGEQGLGKMRPGGLIVDMGSSIPAETRRLAAALAERGLRLMDAPVSGGVAKARAGTLAILAGGADADLDKARPYLEALGETLIRTGAVGSAHAMKALNNFVYAAGLLAAVEALGMAEAAGLDTAVLADVLNASSGRNVATETKLKQFILTGLYAGGFRLGLMAKDLEIAAGLAEETGVDAVALQACRAAWRRALAMLGAEADNTEIHRSVTKAT